MVAVARGVGVVVLAHVWLASLACAQSSAAGMARVAGVYRYVYPHNTAQLTEDHFIVLEVEGGALRGRYYGTSDDFDPGREGYLPGFFVAEMRDLVVNADSVRFTLHVSARDYRTQPVPLQYRRTEDIPAGVLEMWQHGRDSEPRRYRGAILPDRIVLGVGSAQRSFTRVRGGQDLPSPVRQR